MIDQKEPRNSYQRVRGYGKACTIATRGWKGNDKNYVGREDCLVVRSSLRWVRMLGRRQRSREQRMAGQDGTDNENKWTIPHAR